MTENNTQAAEVASDLNAMLEASTTSDEQFYCVFTGKPIEQVFEDIGQELKLEKDCECKFKNEHSNSILICEECSKLPCHNRY